MSNLLKHPLGDGFTVKDIETAMKHMTPEEQTRFLDLCRLNKADYLVEKIKTLEIRKEYIAGHWRDVCGPMLLLRGIYNEDGSHEPLTMTSNPQWMTQGLQPKSPFPYKPYPRELLPSTAKHPEWDYLDWVMHYLLEDLKAALKVNGNKPELYVPKTREMLTSWLVTGFIFWHCQFFDVIEWIGQSEKDDKAMGLIKYANTLYENQPDYLKARYPLLRGKEVGTAHKIQWDHDSSFVAVPQGDRQLASSHPHGYFSDESAHQVGWLSTLNIAKPAVRQIVCVSSAAHSDFGRYCDPGMAS